MTTTTKTADVLESIQRQAAKHSNDEKFLRVAAPVRQGDLYLIPLDTLPEGAEQKGSRQLVPGNSKGSRHVAEVANPGDVLNIYTLEEADELAGPIVEAKQRWTLTHPEHANFSMPSGLYQARYQQDLEQEGIARVQD